MTIGDDVEARGFGKTQSNGCRRVGNLDVFLGWKREAHFDVAVAVVHFHFSAGVFDGDVVGIGAQSEIAGSVGDFQIPRAGFHVAGELSQGQIRALGDEAHALGNFVGADGTVEFAVDGETTVGAGDIHFAAAARDFDVALRVGDFDVPFARINGDVPSSITNFDVSLRNLNDDGLGHVRNGDIAPL